MFMSIFYKEKRGECSVKIYTKRIMAFVICVSLLLQTGCWDQKIYERIGFILQMGLELSKDDKLVYTVAVPIIGPDVKGKVEVLSTSKSLLREAREELRRVSGKAVEGGKTQHVYFSEQLAREGIGQFLEIFIRHTENPLLANVIVIDGSPKEMMELSAKFENKARPAFYVNDLLVNARQNSYIPETRIYDFSVMEFSGTIDPITPVLRYSNKEIEIAGTALFKGDKLVGQIDTASTGMLMALMGGNRRIQYMYHEMSGEKDKAKLKEGAAIVIKGIKRKLQINTDGEVPEIDIKLDFQASLEEYSGAHNMNDTEAKRKLEEEVASLMKKDCIRVLQYLQEVGSDPLGIGELIRARYNSYWKSIEWKDVYKEITFNVDVKVNFDFYGAIN